MFRPGTIRNFAVSKWTIRAIIAGAVAMEVAWGIGFVWAALQVID